jgi:hypothetical protein
MFHFHDQRQNTKPAKQGTVVSIAETITQMQESLLPLNLSFATLASQGLSVVKKMRIKSDKPMFQVGDIVYLNPQIEFVNWRLVEWLGRPFIITQLPVDTQKFKTYTVRLLDDPNNEDCWEDLAFHETFLYKKD